MSARRPWARNFKRHAMLVAVTSLACGAPSDGSSSGAFSARPASTGVSSNVASSSVPWARLALAPGCSSNEEPDVINKTAPAEAVDLAELTASPSSTTPEQISLELNTNLDHVRIHAYLTDLDENPVSGCQKADIYRVGSTAVSWPVGETFTLPLSYEQVLEPGFYMQKLHAYSDKGLLERDEHRMERYFEVTAGGMRPVGEAEYFALVDTVMYDANGVPYYEGGRDPYGSEPPPPPVVPCVEPPPHSDELPPADAISSVDFDSWVDVPTMQPWRWIETECVPYLDSTHQYLQYHARNDAGQSISIGISFVREEPARAFEISGEWNFVPNGTNSRREMGLQLEEPDGTISWSSTAGNVRVQRGDDDQLIVTLSDVVLGGGTRTVRAGSITGKLIRQASLN